MSTHPISLDLGSVVGPSLYEEWARRDGNENRTYDDFLQEITNLALINLVVDSVEEGNTNAVTSGGVWNALSALGLFRDDDIKPHIFKADGSAWLDVLSYSLGAKIAPDPEDENDATPDLTEWIDSATGTNNVWTLSPIPGQEWHVSNAGVATRALKILLPDDVELGSRIRVIFLASQQAASISMSIDAVKYKFFGDSVPSTPIAAIVDATMGRDGWCVIRHFATASDSSDASTTSSTATIVYSGANRKSTASQSYTTTVTWSGTGNKTVTLSKSYFRKLCGVAPINGWATSKTNSTKTYNDGGTVSLSPGQKLVLYPVYTPTAKAVNLGVTSLTTHSTTSAHTQTKSFTFKPTNYLSGYVAGDSYTLQIYGQIKTGADGIAACGLTYDLDGTTYTMLSNLDQSNQNRTNTKTKTFTKSGSIPFVTHAYQAGGSNTKTSKYKLYISTVTIS